MPSVNTIMLIFALAALGILALSALVGFLAGFKRELKLMIVFLVLLGLVWLVLGNVALLLDANLPAFATTMLSDLLSGIFPDVTLGQFTSLRGLIVEVAGGLVPDIKNLLVEGTKTYSLIMSVLEFVLRFVLILVGTIVVYVLCIVIRLLSFVIGSIIRLFTIRRRRRKRKEREAKRETGLDEGVVVVKSDIYDGEVVVTLSRNPKKVRKGKRRGWAAGLGLLRGALTVLLICVPITGLLSIVSEVEPETVDMVMDVMNGGQTSDQMAEGDNDLLDFVFEFADAYDSGIVAEIIGSSEYFLGKPLDETLFDNLLKIETSTQTIYVREELIKLVKIANILQESYDPDKKIPFDVWSLSDVKQDQIFELLGDFKLFAEIMPVAIEFAGTLDMVQNLFKDTNLNFEEEMAKLQSIDWSHDLAYIFKAVRHALELGDITEGFNPLQLNSDVLRDVVANLGATDFVAKLMPIVINVALYLELNPGTENEFKVSDIIGDWPKDQIIVTDGIVWENELVNLVDVYELFQSMELDLANLDIVALLGDEEKIDIIKNMLTKVVTSDLFLDILLEIVDVAKEFQLGKLNFEEFKNILKLTNLVAEDWEADVNTLIDMIVVVEELGVLSEAGIDFYNYDALRELVSKLFDLMILSNKAGVNYQTPEQRAVGEAFNEVKTLLVEAALRQFDLFDIEDEFQFEQFTDDERDEIDWENEKQMLLNVLDVYENLMEFLKTKDVTFDNLGDNLMDLLNYDETFDHLIDLLDALVDSDLAMTLIPYALDKYLVPIIEDFEDQAQLPDGDNVDITDGIDRNNLSEEIFNLIYILMDAKELGLVGAVTGGELNLSLAALAYNPDSESFNEMSDKLGYRPDADTLALVDIINRVFNSRLFEGKEAKLLRVLFAVFLDTRVSKDAINAIDFNVSEDSERAILVSAINGLRPILEDFNEFFVDGELNFDYFLEKTIALDVIDSVRKLFSSEIVAVLLPELYNQYLLPQGMIPEDFAELFNVQSLYLAEHKKDQTYLEGLTGYQLTQDIVTILSIAELLIDFDMLNILASDKDILFAQATDTFNRLFDLVQQLNVLRDNGNKLASILVKMILEVEVPAEEFEELGINWHEEIEGVKGIVQAVFELLERSGIEGYKKLNEVLDNPMDYLENFLVDENVKSLADIITKVSESKVLELLALPLINKFVPGMVDGLEEFTEDEYSGEMACEDIHAFADILYNIAEAELMATIKVVLGEFTDLLPKSDTNVSIPLRHDLYAEIIENLFGLNILQIPSVKEFIVKTLSESLTDMDLSSVTPEGLDFAQDGKAIADAYRAFVESFEQDVYDDITVNDLLAIINGEVELKDLEGIFTQTNLYAVVDLLEGILNTTLVKEFSLVVFDLAKDMLPADFAFLFEVELTEDEFHNDILALMDVVRVAIAQEVYNIIFDKGIPFKDLGNNLRTILETLLNTNLIYKNADNVVMNVLGILDIKVTIEDLANVDYSQDLEAIYAIFNHLEDLLTNANFEDHAEILDFVETLDVNALIEDEEILNNDNLLSIINVLDNLFSLTILPIIFEPAFNQYATDLVSGLGEDLKPLLSIDDYKADAFIADAKALVGILREVVNLDALGIYRGGDINWANTEPIENILKAVFGLNFLNAKLDEIVEFASSDSLDLSGLDIESIRNSLVSDGQLLANTYKLLAQNILAQEWFPIKNIDGFDGLGIDSLPFENLLTYEVLETIGKVVYNIVSMNLVYEALPIGFDMAKDMVPENLAFLVDVELGKEELQADLYAIIDILEIAVDIIEPALEELATNVAGIIDGSVDPLQLELKYNLDNLFVDVKQIAQLIDNMNLIDGRGLDLIIGALALADITVTKEELANVSFATEKDNAELAVAEIVNLLVNNELYSLKDILALADNLSLENTDLINTENVLSILNIVQYVLDSELIRSLFGPIYETQLKDMVPADFASILEFNEDYAARDLLADLSTIVDALQSIVSFEVIEIINAEGEIQWQNIGLVSDGIRQIFSIKLLEAKESAILDLIAEMTGLTLVDVTDIDWSQTGNQLGNVIDHIGVALSEANVLNKLADLDTITDNLDAFLTENIFNEVILALHDLVDASIVEALLPTGINFAAELLGGKLKTALLMDGLTASDYVADLHSIISILTDLNDMGLPEIVKSIMDNDIESLTWRNTGNLVVIVEKLLQLRFWDNKRFEVIEGILELGGVEVPAELRLLDTAKENQILLDVVREIVVLFDTLFAEDGTASVSSITSFLDTLNDSAVLADVINKALTTMSNIFAIEAQSGYIKLLTVPAFNALVKPIVEDFASELFGSANKSIANLDYYGENPEALVNDLLSMSAFFKYIKDSDIVNIALVDGYQIDYGQLLLLGDAFETLFGLELLASKEDVIVNILRGMTDEVELTDGTIDFSNDGTVLKNIIVDLIKFANSGVVVINSLSDLSNLEIVLENLLGGNDPAIKLVFDALKSIAEISVLDEALAFAHHFIIKEIQMPEGLEFVLELGPNGTPGLVNDYLTIVSGIENIFDLRFTDVLFGEDIKLEFAQVLSQFVESIFELDFLAGKGDKAIEYLANEIGYPELADLLPLDWDKEYQAFEDVFYSLEAVLWEAGFFYLSDITDFMGELKSLDQIIDLLDQNVLTNVKTIVKSVAGSIMVQATIGAAAYFALPLVESALPELMKPLVRLDDITIAELIEDVQSLIAIVADIDNFNLFNAILFGEELIYDADAYLDTDLYALQEVFELLFGLNYLNAKLDTIADILVDMNPQFENIDFDFLQAEAVQQVVFALRSESLGMSNFAYDGVKLGQMYANLVETVFSDPKWSFFRLEDFGNIQILDDFYSRNIINGILDAFAAILDLNTVQAAIPFVYELLGDMFQDAEYAFIVDYILETPADELQADIVTIISAFKAIADNHEFIYEEDLREFLKSGNLNKLNFNLSMIEAFPEILDDLSKLNVLNYIKGDRLVEIVQYVLETAMPEFDTTNVNWEALSTLFDYLDENPEELTSFVQVFAILADIIHEDFKYDEFKDLYHDLMNIQISKNEKLLNADVVNSVLDIVDIIINSTLVESFFYAVYDNFLAETVNGMEPVNKLLDVYSYPSVKELQADLTAFINIARELVDFDVLGIVFFEREINWNNTTPIENIFKHIFGLNYLDDEAGLPLIINFLSEMIDLSSLDIKSVADGLAGDAELIGLAYRVLATEIFTKEIFPIHSLADLSNMNLVIGDFLTSEILHSAVNAVEYVLSTNLVKEVLEVAYFLGQMNVPDDLFFLVSQPLTDEQLQSDLLAILDIVREVIDAEVYNVLLENGTVPFEGVSEHLTNILTILFGTNILGNDPINLYVGLLNLVGIEVTPEQLSTLDTAADAQVLYSILGHLEDILMALEITNHQEMLDFVSELDVQALLKDEEVINASNVDILLAILEDVLSLSLLPAIFEPAYNAFVPEMISEMAEDLQALFSIDDYNADAFIADAKSLVYVLRQLIEFGAIDIYFDADINWANTEPIENILETIFALNFLNVKLDEIVTYVSNNMFDLSDLDVEALREKLANDGVILGDVYAILASEVFALEIFPVHNIEDFSALELNVNDFLTEDILTSVIDAVERLLDLGLIYEALPVVYGYAQTIIPDDLFYLVSNPLTKDQLISDVRVIVPILREVVEAQVYNIMLEDQAIPFEGIAEHLTTIIDLLVHTNIISTDADQFVINTLKLFGLELTLSELESVDYEHDLNNLYEILETIETILLRSKFEDHAELLDFVNNLDMSTIFDNTDLINNDNLNYIIDIIEYLVDLSMVPVLYEPLYNKFVVLEDMPEDLQGLLDITEYPAEMFIEDLQSVLDILRNAVDFGALGIYYGGDINWTNIEPIENILETIFALNFLNAKLDEIVTYVSNNMFDLSDLDVEALREKLANDGVILGDVYAILASEVFALEIFPVQNIEDLSALELNVNDFLTEDILTSVIDAVERLLDLGLIYEALPVVYGYAQTIIPDYLFYLVSNPLTKDQLISDVRVIVPILREVVEAQVYNIMLEDQAIPFKGIAEHLTTIIDLLVHTNIISTDADQFVINTLKLFGLELTLSELESVDYEHDLNNLYEILETIETILLRSKFEDHAELLDFVNNLDMSTILDNEDLINNNNLNYIIDIIEYLVDLSMVPALYEPLYNKFVVLEDMPEDLQGLLDITEYPAEMFIEDLQSVLDILRNAVDFDALGIYRGYAIDWANIEAIENVINAIFGLNYLDVKLDEIVTYVSNTMFDLSDLDVEGVDLVLDGAKVAKAYRILAENVLSQNWFPIQFLSDMESMQLDLYYFLDGELLHNVIDALNEILTTSLVYEVLPILYSNAQASLPDDLFFLVSNSLTKDELAEDVQSIILVLREIVDTEIYNAFLGEGVEIEGLADHLVVVLDTIMNTNILGKDLPNVFSGLFNLLGIDLSRDELSAVEFDNDLDSIYKVLNIVEDILLNSKFETHVDILEFVNELNNINAITTNEDILSNANLILVLDALTEIVGLDLLLVVFEPVYDKFVVLENMPEAYRGFLDLSEYPVEMFVEDLQSLISGLRSVVEFDVLSVLRGSAINWSNIEAVENVINQIFGLNYLDVKLDEIVELISNNFFDVSDLDVEAIDLAADGAKVALAYRIIAENILAQSWFPIQFLSDINNKETVLYISDILNETVLHKVVDALNEILTTSLVYEIVPLLYDIAQNKLPNSLFFLVANDLTKDELAEDVQSIVLVLREVINAGVYNVLLNEGIEIEGIADHIATVIETILHTNILGNDLPNLFSGVFGLFNITIEEEVFDAVDFDADLGNIRRALNSIEDILLNAKFATHLDIIDFAKSVKAYTDITKNTDILNNTNLNHLLDALAEIVDLDTLLAIFEPVYNTIFVLENINETMRPFFDISEYPAEMFIEDLQSIIAILRNAVDFDVLGVLRGYEINWENIEAVENVINEIFGLNYLTVKLDEIVELISNNFFDLSDLDVEAIDLVADGAKVAEAYRIIAENILMQEWFPLQIINDINSFKLDLNEIMTESVLTQLVDALNEILTTTIVYELTAVAYDYAQNVIPADLFFLVSEDLTKDELAADVQSIVAVLREAIAAELYKDIIREGIPLEGLASHVSIIIDTLLHTNILGKDYIRLFENIFKLAGLEVDQNDLTYVDFEHDFAQLYAVLENVEDILLNAKYITHLDVLSFMRNMPAFMDIINDNYDLVSDENLHEVLDSLDLLIDLSMVSALYETIYNKFVTLSDYSEKVQALLDIANYDANLFVEDAHALVYVLRQLVEFNGLAIYRGGNINWANTEPIENIITTLFGLNYVDVKLSDIINLIPYESINTSLINVELLRANLEADGQVFAEAYKNIALDILNRVEFPCQTLKDIQELTLEEIKEFYSKEIALQFIEDVRPTIDTELVGELLVVAYDFVQNKVPAKLQYVVEQALTKEELRSDANDILDAVKVLIESDLILLALGRDIPLEGISEPVNELINIAAHTHLIGNDLARFVEGTFELLGMTVSYDDLATVDYEHDLLITYSIVEDIEALLLNCNATTVKGAYGILKDALASGRAVFRNKELVNETNALSVLDILENALDLDLARVLAEPAYAKVMNKVVDALGLPSELADTVRYDYNDCINDARIVLDIVREAIAFGVIDYYQDDVLINWSNTTPVKNMITLGFQTEFWNEFNYELIKFVGDKVGFDLVTGIDIESIDWIQDSYVFAEAYEIIALGILSDPEFTVQRYSEIWTFDFNISDYAKQRYALAGIDALDVCVDTTVFDAYGLTVLRFINNRLPESLQFVIDETTISNAELRSDAHAGLYLAELAINEGFATIVTEKDCDIIKPDFYKEVIKVLFDLNITKDSDVRVRLFNVVLSRLGLEAIDSISDWDSEEQAYLSLVDDVCEFLVKNDLTTAKKLYRFLKEKEFISGSFLTDENVLEILDIMDEAISSEVISKVSASVYAKVVEQLPYEGIQRLVGFGTDSRDYTKEGFYNDLPLFIEIARDMVNLHMLDVLRDKDWVIASNDEINALIEKGVSLSLFDGRLDLFADYVFDVLNVNVDLNGIDWDHEIDVLQNVITIVLPALQESGMIMLSDVKALAREVLDAPVAFIMNNRQYANLTNAYVALDALEELGNSEVYMRSILPLYNRISHKLPAAITDYIDLSTYPEAELRADYTSVLAIVRYGLDGQLYKALSERRGWSFPLEAVEALENIIAIACDMNFTARYTEGAIRMVANVLGISNLPSNLDQISLSDDKDELVSLVASVREIWIGTNHIRPNIPMLANKDLFVEISFVMDTLLDTTLSSVFVPWTYENYVVRIIEKLPTMDGRIDYSKLLSYKGSEVLALAEDGIIVFNELIAMNVFGMSGIDFTDNSHVITMVDILLKHVGFSARIENYLVRLAERSYLMGVIPVSYDQVTSTRGELSVIKGIILDTIELYRTYGSAILSRDFAKLVDGGCESMVLAIIDKLGDSVLLNTSFIPTLNGFGDVVIGSEDAILYTACQVTTISEFKEAVAGLFDILEALEELGFLAKQIKYKDTEGIKELFKLIENSPFVKGQEGILAEFLLRHTDYIDHNEVDLKNINWANEYQYLYEFLDKANAPLNMDGIVITDYKALLDNSVFMNAFADALRAFAPSELMVEMFMPLFDIVEGKFESINGLLDYSHLELLDDDDYAQAISSEYLSVLDLAVAISESGIMSDADLINVNKLLAVYDIVFALEGTKNNKADIFEKLSDKLPSFGDSELVIPDDVNWDTEIPAIRGIFASLIHFADINGNININEIADIISESTDVVAFEALLTAINNSVIYRVQLFDTLNNEINNVSPDGDIVISKYLTDWFKDQEVNGMASIAEWDAEMVYLARILTIVNYMRQNGGFTNLGEMNLGKDVVEHAATVSSDEFNVVNYGLKQLLQLMSASKSFTLTALNSDLEGLLIDNDEYDGIIKTDKHLAELNDAQWDAEINDLIELIHNIQVLGLLDDSMPVADQIKLCTESEIEKLLVSFNHCAAIRDLLPDMLSETLDDSDAEEWKSEWLMNQVGVDALGNNLPMASEADWDFEAKQIAAIITIIDTFDFDKEISTYNQDDIDHLRELLHEMNHDKSLDVSYIIEFLNNNVLDKGLINSTKRFETPTTWDMAKWDLELDRMVDVIEVAIENDLFASDSGNALANMSKQQIQLILNAINNSEIMRTVLPDLVYNAVESAGQDTWLSEDKWLELQVGQTAGVNNPVQPIDEWANEIEKYAFIISKSTSFDFENLELSDNAKLAEIKEILKAMNETKSFTLDPVVDIINDLLSQKGYNAQVIGVIDGANKDSNVDMNGSNKDEWATEIDVLFVIIEKMNSLGTIETNTLSSKSQELGELLDQMKVSYLFGNDVRDDENVTVNDNVFNVLVIDVLSTSDIINDGTNGGFINETDALADDWSRYNWTSELAIIGSYDTQATSQTDAFIGMAQSSEIIKKYFDIAGELNSRIDITFTLLGHDYELKSLVETANGGPLTNEGLASRVWADELNDVKTLTDVIDSFGGSINSSDLVSFALALAGIRNNATLAGGVADDILSSVGL